MAKAAVARTDVLIVGAGPAGLFAAFQLGLFGMSCRLVDAQDRPGGQCAAFYADKPVYDMPSWPEILARDLVDRLLEQAARFQPSYVFGRIVDRLETLQPGGFRATTDGKDVFEADLVVVASGLGPIRTAKPSLPLDDPGSIVGRLGLRMHESLVAVDTESFRTSAPGIFAIGDAIHYPGKLRLILSGFHEAALMTQAARRVLTPGRRPGARSSESSRVRRRGPV